jgi:hypothetical protein
MKWAKTVNKCHSERSEDALLNETKKENVLIRVIRA